MEYLRPSNQVPPELPSHKLPRCTAVALSTDHDELSPTPGVNALKEDPSARRRSALQERIRVVRTPTMRWRVLAHDINCPCKSQYRGALPPTYLFLLQLAAMYYLDTAFIVLFIASTQGEHTALSHTSWRYLWQP